MEVYWKGIPRSRLSGLCLVGRVVDGSWGAQAEERQPELYKSSSPGEGPSLAFLFLLESITAFTVSQASLLTNLASCH